MLSTVLIVFTFAATSFAAPYYPDYHHHDSWHQPPVHHPHLHDYQHSNPAFGNEFFDARRFWSDLTREMMSIDDMMKDLHQRFPIQVSTQSYESGNYKVTIPLNGFEEDEITVKAKNSLLMVQAIHKGSIQKTYIDARNLPEDVDNKGTWTYDGKILVIVFPIKQSTDESEDNKPDQDPSTETETDAKDEVETDTITTNNSREEMETNQAPVHQDADVGLNSNTRNDENDIATNIIPTSAPINVTPYSVDVKDEYEFVPVKY